MKTSHTPTSVCCCWVEYILLYYSFNWQLAFGLELNVNASTGSRFSLFEQTLLGTLEILIERQCMHTHELLSLPLLLSVGDLLHYRIQMRLNLAHGLFTQKYWLLTVHTNGIYIVCTECTICHIYLFEFRTSTFVPSLTHFTHGLYAFRISHFAMAGVVHSAHTIFGFNLNCGKPCWNEISIHSIV